jgi:hypothetical protein
MKIKIKSANIFFYLNILILVGNLFVVFFLYSYINNNVIKAILPDQAFLEKASQSYIGDINMKKFNSIIDTNEKKMKKNSIYYKELNF